MPPKDAHNFSEQLVSLSKLISEMLDKVSVITASNAQYKTDISNLRNSLAELQETVDELHGITFDSAERPSIVARLSKIEGIITQLKSFSQALEESEIVHQLQTSLDDISTSVRKLSDMIDTIEATMKNCAVCRKPKEYHEDIEAILQEYRAKKARRARLSSVIDQVQSGVLVVLVLAILVFAGKAIWDAFRKEVAIPAAPTTVVDHQKKATSP